jgi:hypothetical protein
MTVPKMNVIQPLLDSRQGQHLTAYLTNDQGMFQLRQQLRETLDSAYDYLAHVMNPDALVRFLAPLHNLIEDSGRLSEFRGSVGLFRNENSFVILNLPLRVEATFVVATSYHIKPLLRWMQIGRDLKPSLVEFYRAEDLNLVANNIFDISRAAVRGQVRKLVVADDINIFGKIDRKSGQIAVHPVHLDHEDDDILDDLAQEVLARGGEVIVASQDEIPRGRPILAILDRFEFALSRSGATFQSTENIIERRAV